MRVARGASRTVILTERYAIKIPGVGTWRSFLNGLICNMQERRFADEGWIELCPITFSIPGGWLVVMRRAEPIGEAWMGFNYDWFVTRGSDFAYENLLRRHGDASGAPGGSDPASGLVPAERKPASFGILDGRIVAIDYGRGGSK